MQVFISWSGDRSKALAIALSELLPDVVQGIEIWMSDRDISAGARWGDELNKKLETTNFGVLCLTRENLDAPWLYFEAGSLSKSIAASKVVPYRLGLKVTEVPLPIAQFQGVDADEDGTRKLILSLNKELPSPIEEVRLNRLFDRWWPDFRSRIGEITVTEENISKICDPRVLCGASKQYAEDSNIGFYGDVEVLENAFPNHVTVEANLTSKKLRDLLRKEHFDIIHLVLPVEPLSGDLIFSDIVGNLNANTSIVDKMPAAVFATLVEDTQSSLVFLATCHAYALAVDVSPVTNIVATNIKISGKEAIEWEQWFYDLLSQGTPLYKAYEITKLQYSTPIRLIERKNVVFNLQV